MSASQESQAHFGRRSVVAAVGAAGVAAALTACGGTQDTGGSDTVRPAGSGDGATGDGMVLAKTSDIPEGGGMVFADKGVVVTQPTAGTYKAFSSKCTHQGCAVKGIADGVITCPCHNSTFDATTGEATGGPATVPLPEKQIRVANGSIKLA
ncbi:Rieske (2Fe-2S) protein [Streptomyces sp. NRRL S-4]|uniref:Rieske (2Fe-2S) protein n=1 Tax=Streptomyces sp. NRRL S-4 TaxID=1519471 RepID=UPI0006B5C378|nr:Rieske (2Fe-2S) protein [Streptomyces sp. NRRL S-4]KPC78041.1 iron-sulfur protein [Streptomyces sp. NRRL S-4]